MIMKPFGDLSTARGTDAFRTLTNYRTELKTANDGPADHNKANDVVDLRFDKTVLTAKLAGDNFSIRDESPAGVVDSDYKQTNYSVSSSFSLTTVSRTGDGTYSGQRLTGYSSTLSPVTAERLSPEESEFLFNIHDPSLKPAS